MSEGSNSNTRQSGSKGSRSKGSRSKGSRSKGSNTNGKTILDEANRYRKLTEKYRVLKFDPTCVRKRANLGTLPSDAKFEKWYIEHPNDLVDPEFVDDLRMASPKLHKLLKTIAKLDAKDMEDHGHMFKHFIFSDIKSSTKLLAAGLVASGFRIGVKPIIAKSGKKKGQPHGIEILGSKELAAEKEMDGCKGHFDLMASGSVFSKAMTVVQKKQLFARFNARDDSATYPREPLGFRAVFPRNNHGEQVRIIIMDNGFKEGVDLFDVKYVHIFEPQVTVADTKQVIGRGTRTCGQKGLRFDPERGWPLHVYVYDLDLGASKSSFMDSESAFDLYLKALNIDMRLFKLHDEIEELMMIGSVDYELNKAVHEFKGKAGKEANYSWSRSASSEIPFKLVEDEAPAHMVDGDNNYQYEVAVLPAEMNADALLNDLFGVDVFNEGQGIYAVDAYRVVLDYDMVSIQFNSLSSMQAIKAAVLKVGDALLVDNPLRFISPRINFVDDGSSYAGVDSFSPVSSVFVDETAREQGSLDGSEGSNNSENSYNSSYASNSSIGSDGSNNSSESSNASDYPYLVATFPYVKSNGYKLINKAFGSSLKNANNSFSTDFFLLQGDGDILSLHVVSLDDMNRVEELAYSVGRALKLDESDIAFEQGNPGYGAHVSASRIGQGPNALRQNNIQGNPGSMHGGSAREQSFIEETARETKGSLGQEGGAKITFTPTQDFVSNYFTPQNPIKGMLLNHSVGTGKTCTAIATATASFEPQGYTILWVTRTTLKNDIWKNMFDMVCHHGLMDRRSMPALQQERMKLLSKSWSIRPISYKQFTNLVTKANSYYARLVKKNGAVDPLRKTLLIIDEAHKLFGGNDLSSIERPDTAKLHQALMSSYAISGDDSVRLLLMTATPITKDPLELVKLLNLCRLPDQQIPDTMGEFADTYLKNDGSFSVAGRAQFLDDIAGHISYLNREKDARQFAQPVIHKMMVPLNNKRVIRSFDKQLVSRTYEAEAGKLKTEIATKALDIEEHFKGFDKFMVPVTNVCDGIENGPLKKKCMTAVNKKRMELVRNVKALVKSKKLRIKDIKGEVKHLSNSKKHKIRDIRNEALRNDDYYKEVYMKSAYSKLARCGKVDTSNRDFNEYVDSKPDVQDVDAQVQHWKTVIPPEITALAARIKAEKKILAKPRLQTLKSQLKDMKAEHREVKKMHLKTLKKDRIKMVKTHKKAVATAKKAALKTEKAFKKNLDAMRKLARKEGEVQEILNDELKGLVNKYADDLPSDAKIQEIYALNKERTLKAAEKAAAKLAKEEAQAAKRALAAIKKAAIAEKKEALAAKKAEKAEAMAAKKAAADAKKNASSNDAVEARCKKGTRKYKPMGPGCFTPEEIEAFKQAPM